MCSYYIKPAILKIAKIRKTLKVVLILCKTNKSEIAKTNIESGFGVMKNQYKSKGKIQKVVLALCKTNKSKIATTKK